MTATITKSRTDTLVARLAELRAERDQAQAEAAADASGDIADRATNVDATARFALLEQRINAIEVELSSAPRQRSADGTVAEGDVVTLDFGDGPETFLLGSVDQAGDGLDAVTPGSPLGRALLGATVGATVSYRPRPSRTLEVTIVGVS